MNQAHPFNRCGLAALSDLETPECRELYGILETCQADFSREQAGFRSREYAWPADSLHAWNRVWEYPFAYHHLRQWAAAHVQDGPLSVADVGSGVTSFPFSLARAGCRVACVDVDPVCERDMNGAIARVRHDPGRVEFRLIKDSRLPFSDGEVHAACCISVVEHVREVERLLEEIRRILRPGGLLVLTADVGAHPKADMTPESYARLRRGLQAGFRMLYPETTVHLRDLLHSSAGPFALRSPGAFLQAWWILRHQLFGASKRREIPRMLPFYMGLQGFVAERA